MTTTSTAIILNTGILRTAPGLLKLCETLIGAIVLGLVAYYTPARGSGVKGFVGDPDQTLLFIVSFAFLVTTFLLLISALISLMAATIISKTIFEFLYHLFGFIFYISASLSFLIVVSNQNKHYRYADYEAKMAAAVLGLVNSVLYLLIGAVVLGLVAYYTPARGSGAKGFVGDPEQTLLFIVSFAFLVTTFLLLISALISLMAATIITKTIFEFLYHLFGFIFYISASLSFLIVVSNQNRNYRYADYEAKMAAAVLGLVNSVLYLISTIFSFRFYRLG